MEKSFNEFSGWLINRIRYQKSMTMDHTKHEKLMMKLVLEIQDIMDKKTDLFITPPIISRLNQLQSIMTTIDICGLINARINSDLDTPDKIYMIDLYPLLSDDDKLPFFKFNGVNRTQIVHLVIPLLRKELKEKKYNTFVSNDSLLQMKILCSNGTFTKEELTNKISCLDVIQNKQASFYL